MLVYSPAQAYKFGRQQLLDVPLIELVLPWITSLTTLAAAIPAVQSDHVQSIPPGNPVAPLQLT